MRASPSRRARWQLVAAAVVVAVAVSLLAGVLAWWSERDDLASGLALAGWALVPLAVLAGCMARVRRAAAVAVAAATGAAAVAVAVVVGHLVAVLVVGRLPRGGERSLVLASLVASVVAVLAFGPAWRTGRGLARRWVLGTRRPVEDVGRTLTARASEGVGLDELLQQLAESLRDALGARAVEVWTRPGNDVERTVAVPAQVRTTRPCTPAEAEALASVAVAGDTWLGAWAPSLAARPVGPPRERRVAPAVHTGALLGFVVVDRAAEEPFTEPEDRALADLGRRVGEVLHARRLHDTLAVTLDDLRASRARLVAAADAERRRIERNLHDGAQQHLVALAVSLRLARDLLHTDPAAADELLDELGTDVRDTIAQLRDLAHGIYPPLLVDAGLGDALRAAARRSPLPVAVEVDVARHPTEVEAAIYFCCLEALQNAAKHAPTASVAVRVWDGPGVVRFEVADDGPGFDPAATRSGQGFQNMADRVGAIGGQVRWESVPGDGTRVVGEVGR